MMRSFLCLLAISGTLITSCQTRSDKVAVEKTTHKLSISGKWHRFTRANGYTEFDIDREYVTFYNQKVGRFKLPYKIENDSLIYLTQPYAARIQHFGDSIYLEGNDSTTATLYKFKDPDVPYPRIPEEKDSSSFKAYLKGFDKRLLAELEKAGIVFSSPEEVSGSVVYEELVKHKSRP